jgi:hypothetical protein
MKKLALTICVLLGLAGVAQAQKQQEEILIMPVSALCTSTKNIDRNLKKEYNEIPFAEGIGAVYNSNVQDYVATRTRIFLDPNTFSFSIVIDLPEDNMSCIMITGDEFRTSRK